MLSDTQLLLPPVVDYCPTWEPDDGGSPHVLLPSLLKYSLGSAHARRWRSVSLDDAGGIKSNAVE